MAENNKKLKVKIFEDYIALLLWTILVIYQSIDHCEML